MSESDTTSRQSRMRNVRVPAPLDLRITEHEEGSGETFSDLTRRALYAVLNVDDLEAALLASLGDFDTATFAVSAGPGGEPTVEVAGVQRRTHVPGFPDRPYRPTKAPLTQFVRVEARRERKGRVAVELVGLPPDFASTRLFVCALPTGVDATVTVRLDDLSPAFAEESAL